MKSTGLLSSDVCMCVCVLYSYACEARKSISNISWWIYTSQVNESHELASPSDPPVPVFTTLILQGNYDTQVLGELLELNVLSFSQFVPILTLVFHSLESG